MKIIIDEVDHNLSQDKRCLIPFLEYKKIGNVLMPKIGLMTNEGIRRVEPKYDVVIGDCYISEEIIILGRILSYNIKEKYLLYDYDAYNGYGNGIASNIDSFSLSSDKKSLTYKKDSEHITINYMGIRQDPVFDKLKYYGKRKYVSSKPDYDYYGYCNYNEEARKQYGDAFDGGEEDTIPYLK